MTPIVIFAFKRVESLRDLVASLLLNKEAVQSDLYIFSDGPRSEMESKAVKNVRDYLRTITGFKSINVYCETKNKGLANSIIDGVTKVLEASEQVIVLEDDLVVSSNFLHFMNQALEFYQTFPEVMSVSGFTFPIKTRMDEDVYFVKRACSQGWGTWQRKWNYIDWKVKDFEHFIRDTKAKNEFNKMGSDLTGMLVRQQKGKINSWAIRWIFHQFKNDLLTVYPTLSKVKIFGNDESATHNISKWNRFETEIDPGWKKSFSFKKEIKLEKFYTKQFVKKFSISNRIYYKFMDFIS